MFLSTVSPCSTRVSAKKHLRENFLHQQPFPKSKSKFIILLRIATILILDLTSIAIFNFDIRLICGGFHRILVDFKEFGESIC
ncbi:hypothetical protein L6452_36773 [Arctium lappa]|uniref:Uncharacterized protein n=1 Tax=Arctium lappa TaxID=4217 RepID=A0ACB8Y2A8_ARCLA|nr:hypothetical protein L6452_36773 [Arctium lappa]